MMRVSFATNLALGKTLEVEGRAAWLHAPADSDGVQSSGPGHGAGVRAGRFHIVVEVVAVGRVHSD